MRSPVSRDDIFPFALFAFIVLMWVAMTAALLKVFNAWVILLIAVVISIIAWRWVRPEHGGYLSSMQGRTTRVLFVATLVLICIVSVMNFYFFHDSLNGNRDEGLYANDAAYLANHGDLPFPRFDGNDTRLFLNTAWNAELYGLFGYTGMRLCNVIPFALALICIFLLVKDLTDKPWAGLAAVFLISLSYPFLWYARRTNNEILFFSLVWIAVYLFSRCMRRSDTFRTDLTLFMLIAPLPAFIRPEGLIVSGVCCLGALFLFLRRGWKTRLYRVIPFIILMVVLVIAIIGGYRLMDTKYNLGKIFERNIGGGTSSGQSSAQSTGQAEEPPTNIYSRKSSYATMAMIDFGFLPAILLILPFFILLLLERDNRTFAVFLAALTLPFAFFLFKPNIAFDFPWFIRRYVTVLIPLALIAFSYVVFKLKAVQAAVIVCAFIALTLVISAPVIFHQDYPGTVERLDELATFLPDDVKILVDRYTLGDFQLAGPLFFVYDMDVTQVIPWTPVSYDKIARSGTVYLITNADDWRNRFLGGSRVFDASVNVDDISIVKEMIFPISYIQPTCEFHRGGNENSWTSMDYRIALSNVEVPSRKVCSEYRVLVVRLDISTANRVAEEVTAQ